MKLQFERWCEANNVKGETLKLFNEGVICYKIGAYRASFIMTYLGFQHELRNRIVTSHNKPDNIKDSYWKQIIEKVQDDNSWDTEVFNIVNRTKPDNIFLIDDDIRKKYDYWRSIRNDCAHAKGEIISNPHIESFWLFIESNYNKFVINGGKAGLLDKIRNHYDIRYTELDKDLNYIVDNILSSVKVEELQILLEDIYNMFKENDKSRVFSRENPKHGFWHCIIHSESKILRDAMMNFVKKDKDLFIEFISYHPEQISTYLSDKALARKIWTEWITDMFRFFMWVDMDGFLEEGDKSSVWICVKKLLEENIIPQNEINNFLSLIWSRKGYPGSVPYNMVELMYNYQYFNVMRMVIFDPIHNTTPLNDLDKYWYALKGIIVKLGIKDNEIILLEKLYREVPHGEVYRGLDNLLDTNKEFRTQYIEVLKKHNIEVHSKIKQKNK
ncbi:hypothetical protein QJL30_09865 [Clostridioides difficile]|uniref:Uncharacterized protein n=1 Tax=Clostridioides difficile TaxID=1496 RepID=A0A386JC57_CLODI|nr:hypothetical protein [Clostridioides difficile]EQF29827.1 hypothetical protein QEW_4600 [Clostridioides difficile CD160]AYD68715.1 hypothetical protein pHSJD-312_00094 [Clostridioides difficile]MDI2882375.1 hypothetical protein [Clostridioides difficile]MDI3004244.1 hypothetical protein [Clostridioides difficile]HBG7285415.1 hypothetical protein [Clostridioides difficile]